MLMNCSSFESPKPYVLGHCLKNSIPAFLKCVILTQSNPILLHTEGNGCIFFGLAAIQCVQRTFRITLNLIVFMDKGFCNSSYNPFGKACLHPTSPWSYWTIWICSNFMLSQHNFSGKDYMLIEKDSPLSLQISTSKLLRNYNNNVVVWILLLLNVLY